MCATLNFRGGADCCFDGPVLISVEIEERAPVHPVLLAHVLQRGGAALVRTADHLWVHVHQQRNHVEAWLSTPTRVVQRVSAEVVGESHVSAVGHHVLDDLW